MESVFVNISVIEFITELSDELIKNWHSLSIVVANQYGVFSQWLQDAIYILVGGAECCVVGKER